MGTAKSSPDAVLIDVANVADASAIGAVQARAWAAAYPDTPAPTDATARAVWQRRIAQDDDGFRTVIARVDGRIVGFAHAGPAAADDAGARRTGHIQSLYVDPGFARRGIGRRLLEDVLQRFAEGGYADVTLWVVETNGAARRFYERLGWLPDGGRRREALVMDGDDGPMVVVVRYRHTVEAAPQSSPA